MALAKPSLEIQPLYTPGDDPAKASVPVPVPVPDAGLLDAEEATMLTAIRPPDESSRSASSAFRAQIRERLVKLRAAAQFQADHLASNVHVLDQRVAVAGREADLLLRLGAARLKAREDREKAAVGTKDMPVMEVLRSLSRILPDEGGS